MAIPVWLRIRLFTCAVPLILIAAGVAGATPQDGRDESTATLALSAGRAMLTRATRLQTSAHGSEQMPVWGSTFRIIDASPAVAHVRVANLLAYLKSIQQF
jgi:hypothetical protein